MNKGYYSLILHAHLPYVRHEEDHRLEQNWLFEAITESYIPLVHAIDQANQAHAVTLSLSPPLMEMLADSLLQKRFVNYLKNVERLLKKEIRFQKQHQVPDDLLAFYKHRYSLIREFIKKWNGQLLSAFKDLHFRGLITCITSSATHTFLPYLLTERGVRLQIQEGIRCFEKHFQFRPKGFWVPECAFNDRVDKVLAEEGIQYTFVDEHALTEANPRPEKGSGAPVMSKQGVALFPRHTSLSAQVWSSTEGYPGDEWYREFYRDIAYEREWSYIKPHMHPEGIRFDTGLKFSRVTGQSETKAFYSPKMADERIAAHANHFIEKVTEQAELYKAQCFPPYIMVTPFDAELFGHWWFEGPAWIECLIKQSQDQINWITPELYLEAHVRDLETVDIPFTTWGRDGYGSVWINEKNSWVYPIFHQMEETLCTLVSHYQEEATDLEKRALNQLKREWMLATSSDWAFIIDGDTATEYAISRVREHEKRFNQLLTAFLTDNVTPTEVTRYEKAYPFLMNLKGDAFLTHQLNVNRNRNKRTNQPSVLLLTWEYPPITAGGLSIHVSNLAAALAKKDVIVHVVTSYVNGLPSYEKVEGVHVHRVQSLQPHAPSFHDWIGGLNFAMVKAGEELAKRHHIDLIHAHDWLVSVAAIGLKQKLQIPIIATIHATEQGRMKGKLNQRQVLIKAKEERLMHEAKRIIVCSESMKHELNSQYRVVKSKLSIIPNASRFSEKVGSRACSPTVNLFSFGRLVPEKGFQFLLEAMQLLKKRGYDIQLQLAGEGPYYDRLSQLTESLKLTKHVSFKGFLQATECLAQLEEADIVVVPSLYEPFGLSALEAMSVGKPVIASSVGGLKELIIHKENGLLFEPGNVNELAQQIVRLIEEPIERTKMAEQAALVAEGYSWKRTADYTLEQINEVMSEQVISTT
ncbi:1,4-alpha-glucan branching protein domain-containing protein [Alkalicoccobacillus gibsonii]|uniref:1,4-alpha-glucan branching protein domain-containing protein n=1 Tax=Alkalicoccobacillus gibsonii TaxID=79881 RepID=A0ABU9VGV9_9BACI